MEKIRNLSLKKTIILYMTVSLLCSFLLSAVIVRAAAETQKQIWWKYIDKESYYRAQQQETDDYTVSIPRISRNSMTEADRSISELCDFLETYTVLFLSVAASCIAVTLFYKNKLKAPIEELHEASNMIAENELEFQVTYRNQDELGQLCREFERMRAQLEENNRTLWHMAEEEKALRTAIAHDIRSPLSVLKGYQEMLLEFVPEENLGKEKIVEMLLEGMKQIERLDHFIETMQSMIKLEDRKLQFTRTDTRTLGKQIEKEAEIISKTAGKTCRVSAGAEYPILWVDTGVVLEVVENLLSNALRYAKEEVKIVLSSTEQELVITVMDDGSGFTDPPEIVTKAFYHSNPQDSLEHFGMGMYISRMYCEQHGGRLLAGNQEHGGAIVKAVFKSNVQ